MNKFLVKICLLFISLMGAGGFVACSEPEEPAPIPQRLILIYAVAANNLESNLRLDMQEILSAAHNYDLKNNALLVYSVVNTGECKLQKLERNSKGSFEYVTIATFPETPLSTSEERINDVIGYVNENFQYPYKGLILWSHADGWLPWFQGSTPGSVTRRSFGLDNYDKVTYKTNINALADAIPEGVFDFIWFDCCYMGNIETLYQLREKTSTIVGSVLEIHMDGMPYHLTMPYLLRKDPDLEMAAQEFFDYYNESSIAVSISITDTEYLPMLADAASKYFRMGTPPTVLSNIQNYSRLSGHPFYDMGQLLNAYTGINTETSDYLKEALAKTVKFKLISPRDFNHHSINVAGYSGLSMHNFKGRDDQYEDFYRELDWFKATR